MIKIINTELEEIKKIQLEQVKNKIKRKMLACFEERVDEEQILKELEELKKGK